MAHDPDAPFSCLSRGGQQHNNLDRDPLRCQAGLHLLLDARLSIGGVSQQAGIFQSVTRPGEIANPLALTGIQGSRHAKGIGTSSYTMASASYGGISRQLDEDILDRWIRRIPSPGTGISRDGSDRPPSEGGYDFESLAFIGQSCGVNPSNVVEALNLPRADATSVDREERLPRARGRVWRSLLGSVDG